MWPRGIRWQTVPLFLTLGACHPAYQRPPRVPTAQKAVAETAINGPLPLFVVNGSPFCFQGANNYYLHYKSRAAVTAVLDAARAMSLPVVRSWAFLDRGALDGSVANAKDSGEKEGVYFQYWDVEKNRPAYNDGPTGLEKLDVLLHEARARDLRLILVLTNNWRDFGGIDQYLIWYGLTKHYEFYTDPRVRSAYKDWVAHLINRVNSVDGVPYKEDPAIFSWELANEPRAGNFESFDSPLGWNDNTIATWAAEMSAFIKTLDHNHMVSVGDEGFLPGSGTDPVFPLGPGIDGEALSAIPTVDFGTYHLYPDHWLTSDAWGTEWIERHLSLGRRLQKPMLLEEYGTRVARRPGNPGAIESGEDRRRVAYGRWNQTIRNGGGPGALFWMLAAEDAPGHRYPDYDHFTIYPGDEGALLTRLASQMQVETEACITARGHQFAKSPFVRTALGPGSGPPRLAQVD